MAYRLEELKNAKILKRELNERVSRYTHLELKNTTFLSSSGNTRISAAQ